MKTAIVQTFVILAVAGGSLVFAQSPSAAHPGEASEASGATSVRHQTPSATPARDASAQPHPQLHAQEHHAATDFPFLDLRRPVTPQQTATAPTLAGNSDLFVGLGVWTVIVLCLCVLTVLGIRQWQRGRGMLPVSNSSSRVLETVSLGPNRMISLVALGDVRAIVGCDAAGIRSIVLAPPRFEEELSISEHESDT